MVEYFALDLIFDEEGSLRVLALDMAEGHHLFRAMAWAGPGVMAVLFSALRSYLHRAAAAALRAACRFCIEVGAIPAHRIYGAGCLILRAYVRRRLCAQQWRGFMERYAPH